MPLTPRRTAVVRFAYSRVDESTSLPFDQDRAYEVILTIDGETVAARQFSSPFGDERWREIVDSLRQCTSERTAPPSGTETEESAAKRRNKRRADEVEGAGRSLYRSLAELRPELRTFLEDSGSRRLVIESRRPEIHALPWEALTNEHRQLLAHTDLSIVRCQSTFNEIALPSPGLLNAFAVRGPATPQAPLQPLESVGVAKEGGREIGIRLLKTDDDAQLLHLVAHGDPYEGTIAVRPGELLVPSQLAARYQNRLMVLLWSCYSAMVHSTGDSVTMALQRAGNRFVLSFVAPLAFDAAARIAVRFYDQVFGEKGHQDPETAVTRIRSELRATEFEFCDWASMTLWLERPVDLSRLPLGRVRLPKSSWSSEASPESVPAEIRAEFERTALGDLRLVSGVTVATPLPTALVRQWTGPVVHLDGPKALLDDAVFESLGLDPRRDRNPHPADVFLHLLDHLATYPFALLVWTSVTDGVALLAQTLDRVPPNVGLLLISPHSLTDRWPGQVVGGSHAAAAAPRPAPQGREGFLQLVQEEQFESAFALNPGVHYPDAEYWSNRYVACVKTGQWEEAKNCISALKEKNLDRIEAELLEGNLHLRSNDHLAAMDSYQRAADAALQQERWREVARVRQELAYVVEEMGDRGLAEQYYLGALNLLNETLPERRDTLWSSALGRVLRDYAHLLAKAGDPRALPLIRRAAAIHALDGRRTQVAYCFVTRSELECRLGKYDAADESAHKAGIVFNAARNTDGLVDAVSIAARTASTRNRDRQALAILRSAISRPLRLGLLGKLFLQIAEVCWASGQIDDAAANARGAIAMLSNRYRRELAAAHRLKEMTAALTWKAAPRVAALAGRMDADAPDSSLQAHDELRGRLCRCFVDERIQVLVCSAARGADLLALDVAGGMGIRRLVVLPFAVDEFRQTSVAPPGTKWNEIYQRVIDDVTTRGDLVVVGAKGQEAGAGAQGGDATYKGANERILAEARTLAGGQRPVAVLVWEGQTKGDDDTTEAFRQAAAQDFDVKEILLPK